MDEMKSIELLQPNPPPPARAESVRPREAESAVQEIEEYAVESGELPRSPLPYDAGLVLDMFA